MQSGIQEPGGGVGRYYRCDLRRNARVSTEITGYAVSAFVYLFTRTGRDAYLDAALRAARFLTAAAWKQDLSIYPFEHGDGAPALAYFFDTGIIVRGLLALWNTTADPALLDRACEAAESMSRDFADGSTLHPILELPSKRPLPHEPQWSRRPGCYQLKSAMAWHDLAELTGEPDYYAWFEATLETALAGEQSFLPGETPEKTMDRLHAYAYFLEALLKVAERGAVRAALAGGIQRATRYLREIAPCFERSDVYAQLLRVRLIAEREAGVPLDEAAAAHEAEELLTFQFDSADSRSSGAFSFGRRGDGLLPFANPVSTAFCVQAHEMWQDRGRAAPLIELAALI
ncbi:MAG: hypothetical protein HYS04_09250 [Acidobacteria bacterium]|nr:hypothetical protein [Acidobacteriota bacterium]